MQATQLEQQIASLMQQQQQAQADAAAPQPHTMEIDPAGRDDEWKKLIVSSQKKDEYITDLEKHLVFYKSKAKQMQVQLQQLIRDTAKCNQHDDEDNDDDGGDDGGEDERERGEGGSRRPRKEDSHQLKLRIKQLEEANDTLMKDLATAKVRWYCLHDDLEGGEPPPLMRTPGCLCQIYLRSSKSRSSSPGDGAAHVVRVSRSELRELPGGLPSRPPSSSSRVRDQ